MYIHMQSLTIVGSCAHNSLVPRLHLPLRERGNEANSDSQSARHSLWAGKVYLSSTTLLFLSRSLQNSRMASGWPS